MQQGLQNFAGDRPIVPMMRDTRAEVVLRHRALLLIGERGPGRITPRLARRALDRLLAPTAQVEGVDWHLADPHLAEAAQAASTYVLVLPPLGNLSNAFYTVHPRRNDRFVAARPVLKALYPDVDFAPFTFTGHALDTLAGVCPERFMLIRRALEQHWAGRMRHLLDRFPRRGVLIELPAQAWLQRPAIAGEGRHRIRLDPDNRASGCDAVCAALQRRAA